MILEGFEEGFRLLATFDPDVWSAIRVSLMVSLSAILLATLAALPVGLAVGLGRFRGRRALITLLNTCLALPTVLLGLLLYAVLCRRGWLGSWGLLYTPAAMALGQMVLAFPIVAALTVAAVEKSDPRASSTALALGAGRSRWLWTVGVEIHPAVLAAVLAGFGRVFSEVGLSMMLGGNIRGTTRNITTAIALETSKGEFATGVALGIVLLAVALGLNLVVSWLQVRGGKRR